MSAHTVNRPRRPGPRPRTLLAALGAATLIVAPLAAHADTSDEIGSVGSITVEPSTDLPLEGAEVVVQGTDFDPSAGIYVAVCVDNGPGEKPTPCIGGADTTGVGGATWISDDPPSYAEGLTLPYGPDGSFEVTLPVPATDDVAGVDCRVDTCAVTVRFDHLRGDDRRADHVIPLTFTDGTGEGSTEDDGPAGEDIADGPGAETDQDAEVDEPAASPTDEPTPTEVPADTDVQTGSDGATPVAIGVIAALFVAAAAIGVWLVRRRRTDADEDAPTAPADD